MEFVSDYMAERNREQKRIFTALPSFPDFETDFSVVDNSYEAGSVEETMYTSYDDGSASETVYTSADFDEDTIDSTLESILSGRTKKQNEENNQKRKYIPNKKTSTRVEKRKKPIDANHKTPITNLNRNQEQKRKISGETSVIDEQRPEITFKAMPHIGAASAAMQIMERAESLLKGSEEKRDRAFFLGQSVTAKLRQFNEKSQILIEKKINDLIFEEEMKALEQE